jgi:exodeoxyribonuclease VII large subunit
LATAILGTSVPTVADDSLPLPIGSGFPLTPSAFLEAMAACLDHLHGGDAAPVLLRAIPVKTAGTGREYSGFIYATLRDPRTSDAIDAWIPVSLAGSLEWNREAVFVGLVHYKARRGELRPEFRVDAVQEAGPLRLPSKDELLQRWSAAIARPKRDMRAALQGQAPRLAIITGVGSVAVDDIHAQLREAEADLALDVVRVSMHRPAVVARAIRQAADAQAVALTRGGGQDVHELDTEELIGAVASSLVPVVVALGHASDELVVGRVADACFPTPTALGAWLRDVVEDKRRQARQTEEARLLTESKDLLAQLGRLQALQASLGRWRLLAVVAVVLWVAMLLWLLLQR